MNTAFSFFSPQQWRVMQALNTYRFLTVDHMLRLGISKNAKSLRDKTLFALRHHKCVRSEKIGSFLPDIHHLTKRGIDCLSELEKISIQSPPRKRLPFSPVFAEHRFAQIDYHIGFRKWADLRGDAEILLELQDFNRCQDSRKGRFVPATELVVPELPKPVVPDGIFGVALTSGKVVVYLVEVHRTTQTKAVTEQLTRYFEVIKSGVIQKKFGHPVHPVICSIHHQKSVCFGVKMRLAKNPEFACFRGNFVFQKMDNLKSSFSDGWHFADDSAAQPFPNKKAMSA